MKKILNKLYNSIESYFDNESEENSGIDSFYRAMKCYDNREYEEALRLYKIALQEEPNSDATYSNMGNVYFMQKEYDQALILYKQALLLNSQSPNAHRNIGGVYHEQQNYKEAIPWYLDAEKTSQGDKSFYMDLATCYSEIKEYSNAKDIYIKALGFEPNNEEILMYIGFLCTMLEQYQESINYYKKAVTLNCTEFNLSELGLAYFNNYQNDEAKNTLEKILELNSYNQEGINTLSYIYEPVFSTLGYLYSEEKNYSLSIKYHLKSFQINNQNIQNLTNITIVYFRTKEYEKSMEFALKWIEKESENSDPYLNILETLLIQNKPFLKTLELQFKEKFENDTSSYMLYESLKILKDISLKKEVKLDDWKEKYKDTIMGDWEFESLDEWAEEQKEIQLKEKLLEALSSFKSLQ